MNSLDFACEKPVIYPDTIDKVICIETKGPWKTKAKANLSVLYDVSNEDFFTYDINELKKLPSDIRGLRTYIVKGLKKGSVSGIEFHRVRRELFFCLEGVLEISLEDVYGNKKSFILENSGVYFPTFIFHTVKTIKEGQFLITANTLFNPDDPMTHDTYSLDIFKRLQSKYIKR